MVCFFCKSLIIMCNQTVKLCPISGALSEDDKDGGHLEQAESSAGSSSRPSKYMYYFEIQLQSVKMDNVSDG